MKRFIFRLQPILQFRQYRERLARQETALALREVQASEAKVAELTDEHTRTALELDAETSGGILASEFKTYTDYLDSLEHDISDQILTTRKLAGILAQKQKLLAKKSVDRKVMERLREKRAHEYMDEFLKLEQKTLDEITSVRKAREINNGKPE
ncbi:MAG: flagellar export protein FliJ [Pseudomonadota bacterium]